jgi:hypothetical protein
MYFYRGKVYHSPSAYKTDFPSCTHRICHRGCVWCSRLVLLENYSPANAGFVQSFVLGMVPRLIREAAMPEDVVSGTTDLLEITCELNSF